MTATIQYTPKQQAAIDQVLDWYESDSREFYLAGYAGTGKTTIVEEVIRQLEQKQLKLDGKDKHLKIITAAYTGKAANVLRQRGARSPMTIHKMIYHPTFEDGKLHFDLTPEAPANSADLIILDECSMVGEQLAEDIRSFKKKILVIGDPGQLPPVKGAGAFTSRAPDYFLDEIHRQAEDSPIIKIATQVRQSTRPKFGEYGPDVRVVNLRDMSQTAVAGFVTRPDTQVIVGSHKTRFGITQTIRESLGFDGIQPHEGERILCCKNNHEEGYFNGMQGEVKAISLGMADTRGGPVEVYDTQISLDDINYPIDLTTFTTLFEATATANQKLMGDVPWDRKIDLFDFGYVLTCHKAQGSQWDHVTIIDDSSCFGDNKWKWLYTAVTRASKGLTLLLR